MWLWFDQSLPLGSVEGRFCWERQLQQLLLPDGYSYHSDGKMCAESILEPGLSLLVEENGEEPVVKNMIREAVEAETKSNSQADAAVGAMFGLVVGDAVGAPLEFTDCDSQTPSEQQLPLM